MVLEPRVFQGQIDAVKVYQRIQDVHASHVVEEFGSIDQGRRLLVDLVEEGLELLRAHFYVQLSAPPATTRWPAGTRGGTTDLAWQR